MRTKGLELITPPARKVLWAYRKVTWRQRAIPDFVIIGAQKSGTTSLFFYLCKHPQLVPSFQKEVHFFDGGLDPTNDNFALGEPWYRSHFPLKVRLQNGCKTYEASPLYMFHPLVAERMSLLLPDVKIIAVLRNPTERALSHYFHSKRYGQEALNLADALAAEEDRLKSAIKTGNYNSHSFIHHSYKSRGIYYDQLIRFGRHFPNDRFLVLSSEDLFDSPHSTLRRTCEFVGIDVGWEMNGRRPYNVARSKGDIDPNLRKELDKFFFPHNQRLYRLVGRNFGW